MYLNCKLTRQSNVIFIKLKLSNVSGFGGSVVWFSFPFSLHTYNPILRVHEVPRNALPDLNYSFCLRLGGAVNGLDSQTYKDKEERYCL